MDIANLLAAGVRARPAGMEQNALMQGQEMQQRQMQNALMQMNMQAAMRQDAQAQQQAQEQLKWRNALQVPQGEQYVQPGRPAMNAAQAESAVGTPGYGMSSAQDQVRTMPADPRMVQAVQMAKAGMMSPMDLFKIQNPERKTASAAAGSMIYDERTGQMIAQVPDKAKQDEFVARMVAAGIDPASPQGRAMLMDKLRKDSTHQPAPSFNNYGSPLPVDLGNGKTGYIQPPTRPGAPTQIINVPGTNQPAIKPPASDTASEDERKAAGWLAQADNAWKNMQKVALDPDGNLTSAARPGVADAVASIPGMSGFGNAMRGPDRQKFVQASSSLSEAILRAATGAGVNEAEAVQKVQELTPVWGEDKETTKQKFAAIPVYLRSLQDRAGRAAKKGTTTPEADNTDPLGIRGLLKGK